MRKYAGFYRGASLDNSKLYAYAEVESEIGNIKNVPSVAAVDSEENHESIITGIWAGTNA